MHARFDRYPRLRLASMLLLMSASASCGRRDRNDQGRNDADARAPLPTSPDRLARDEIAEGPELAFGIPVPRDLHVERRFVDMVAASSDITATIRPEALMTYVERHVTGGTIELGSRRTVFRGVSARSAASHFDLEVEIAWDSESVHFVVVNRTKPPIVPGLDEGERWRRAGFNPGGKVIDPKQME